MITEIITNFNLCINAEYAIRYLVSLQNQYPDLKYKNRTGAYIYKNYYILPNYTKKNSEFLKNLKKNLNLVNPICKTSSPELVDILYTADEKFSAIIYKVNYSDNADLIPYLQTNGAMKEKIDLFKSEQINLLNKSGVYNPKIFTSVESFYLTLDTGNIVFEDWSELEKVKNSKEVLHKINSLL